MAEHPFAATNAIREALIAAVADWPTSGIPGNPRAWLMTVATRRLIDQVRNESSRRQREDRLMFGSPPAELSRLPGDEHDPDRDDTLTLLLLCCHPALSSPSQIALTLKAVGGLTTAEIARAFFVPEATMAQRVSRAKQRIREAGATFSGAQINRTDLTAEAIRLTRSLHRVRPADGEVAGLLALMLLTEARRAARVDASGELVSLADQVAPNPMASVNRALAVAMVRGPDVGLDLLASLDGDSRVARHHRLFAMRGHLLEMDGSPAAARAAFEEAARQTASAPEKRYLLGRAHACSAGG